ncbi:MAG TPA: hypothetical protein VNJ01_05110 [Bacteriovoracaceae bacterium]|nr:hypothetical protein [Bacteriovoracaceae bacterium]
MKAALITALLMFSAVSFAQTTHELKVKKEMLARVEILILSAREIRSDLKTQKVVPACEKVQQMRELFPDHVRDMGSYLDLYNSKTNKAINEGLAHQIYIHKLRNQCREGNDSEYVDMGQLAKEMKTISKVLEKHRKLIKKSDTDHDNSFSYEYEF